MEAGKEISTSVSGTGKQEGFLVVWNALEPILVQLLSGLVEKLIRKI